VKGKASMRRANGSYNGVDDAMALNSYSLNMPGAEVVEEGGYLLPDDLKVRHLKPHMLLCNSVRSRYARARLGWF
jgi:hypothetical protein